LFLPPCPNSNEVAQGSYMNLNPLILSEPRQDSEGNLMPGYMDLRYRLQEDLIGSLEIIKDTDREFKANFGRSWGGLVWTYRMEDAEHALVSMGSLASECTVAADSMRQQGYRTGVVGVKAYRPFPANALVNALSGTNTVSVFEKDVSYGYEGALATDLKAAFYEKDVRPKIASFVAGLGGRDVRPEQIVETSIEALSKKFSHKWIDVRG